MTSSPTATALTLHNRQPTIHATSSTVKSADCNITSSAVKHINSNSTYFRKSSAVYPSYASSTLKSTSNTAQPPGPRAAVSMAVLPSANQLVMVQQQPIFYSTT
ncbi:unnamed protein product [Arctogadus glacialis]